MLYIKELFILFLLVVVVAGSLGDIVHDYREGASMAHMAVESLLVAAATPSRRGLSKTFSEPFSRRC